MNNASKPATATDLFSLHGKHAVVTGGGSGIGLAIAKALSAAGARLTLLGRDGEKLNAASAQLASSASNTATFACDLSVIDEIDANAAALMQKHGAADILINAAGLTKREPAAEVTPATWRAILDTNLSAPFFLARALAPAMVKNDFGRIVNIASLQSRLAFDGGIAYGASKGGIAQLTRAMANEWSAHGINANAIAPGFFPTKLTQVIFDDSQKAAALAARTAIGRNGRLEEIGGVAVFLCAPASAYITGQVLYVDGGFTVK